MKYLNTSFIKLTLVFVAGILAGFFISDRFNLLFLLFTGLFVLFMFAYFRARKLFFQDVLFGISSVLLFFIIGILTTQLHLPKNQPQHYTNLITPEALNEERSLLMVLITEELKPDLYNRKFIAEVEKVNTSSAHGKILLLSPRDSLSTTLEADNRLILSSALQPVPAPLNPHQFNYRKFMENRGIMNQVQLYHGNFQHLSPVPSTPTGLATNLRTRIVSALETNGFEKDELAIIQALLLGQRQDISEETYNNYAAAGAMHILAVSGLHVGIILLLLHRLFSPLERLKNGKFFKTILLILLLWLFALLAGLSPSVVRAVTMFSFVAIGLQIKRRSSVINTLFMSMMVLLLVKPQFIFEVGFQLSYLAVFSIVLLQPLLYALFEPRNSLIKYLWGLLTVTISAQAGVLPLSLFYFHQFPGLFFLSNLVILPLMGIILALGIVIIIFALAGLLPLFLAETYSLLIESLNKFVGFVADQEQFLFRDIPFSGYEALGFYLLLSALFLLLIKISYTRIIFALSTIVVLQLIFYMEIFNNASEEFIVFHKSRSTLIGTKTARNLLIGHRLQENPEDLNVVRNYAMGEKTTNILPQKLQNMYGIGNDLLVIIDSSAIYPMKNLSPEYILLINSPRVNLNRLLKEVHPKVIIADGSNYKSFVARWRQTCEKNNITFHATGTRGAFIIQ